MRKLLRFSTTELIILLINTIIYLMFLFVGFFYQFSSTPIPINLTGLNLFSLLGHNSLQILLNIVLGIVSLGIYVMITLFLNGFTTGVSLATIFQSGKVSLFAKNFLPHAIFEIPAYIFASAIPLLLYIILFRSLKLNDGRLKYILNNFKKSCVKLAIISYVCIFIAAIIETITSNFLR